MKTYKIELLENQIKQVANELVWEIHMVEQIKTFSKRTKLLKEIFSKLEKVYPKASKLMKRYYEIEKLNRIKERKEKKIDDEHYKELKKLDKKYKI